MALTTAQRSKLLKYVRSMADTLGLKDWTITISPDPVEKSANASAQVTCPAGAKIADIEFGADFASKSREEQRWTVVHELVHLHFEPMALMTEEVAKKTMSPEAGSVFSAAFIHELEYGVDGVAVAVSPLLPLPPALGKA